MRLLISPLSDQRARCDPLRVGRCESAQCLLLGFANHPAGKHSGIGARRQAQAAVFNRKPQIVKTDREIEEPRRPEFPSRQALNGWRAEKFACQGQQVISRENEHQCKRGGNHERDPASRVQNAPSRLPTEPVKNREEQSDPACGENPCNRREACRGHSQDSRGEEGGESCARDKPANDESQRAVPRKPRFTLIELFRRLAQSKPPEHRPAKISGEPVEAKVAKPDTKKA